jgi:3-deoxy-D-manno-octulosonate 8-phosphate phosphatase (KDO 8-P phosphatase)
MPSRAALNRLAKPIRLIAMDVDGVLTGGEVVVLESGEEIKFWNAKDRLGMALVRDHCPELSFAWVTGRKSNAVKSAAQDLGVKHVVQNCMNKRQALVNILNAEGLKPHQVAFIGDDLIDLSAIKWSGFSACPKDAVREVRSRVDYVSSYKGGAGVVRDVMEIVLKAQGKWEKLVQSIMD